MAWCTYHIFVCSLAYRNMQSIFLTGHMSGCYEQSTYPSGHIRMSRLYHLQSHPWILEPVFEVGDDDVPKAARNSSNDHVDRIIDQRDHDNPQTSEHLWSPRLCRTTSSHTRMPNTTARPRRQTVYGHLQQAQFWQSFSSQHHCPQYHHPQHAHHPQSLAAPMAAHGRTPSMVISPRSVGGVIVPRPESSENWLNTRPGLSGPYVCRRRPPHRRADRIRPEHRLWIGRVQRFIK